MKIKIIPALLIFSIFIFAGTCYAAEDTDLAYGANASAVYYDSDNNMLPADLKTIKSLTDDNQYSLYKTPIGVETGHIIIDMYKRSDFNRVYIREINSTINGYKLYASDNSRSWRLLWTGKSVGTYGANAMFADTKARFLKLEITSTENKYKDACITFSDIKVMSTSEIVYDDLSNAVYLANIKYEYMNADSMKSHFTDEERNELYDMMQKGKEMIASASSSQSEVTALAGKINSFMMDLDDNIESDPNDFAIAEQKYFDNFVKNNVELTDSRKKTITGIETAVETSRANMIRQPKATELWSEYIPPMANSSTEPGKISNSLAKVKQWAIAYEQTANKYYKDKDLYDDIIYALNFIMTKKYDPSIKMYGNWYYWDVSIPATLTDIMVIMKGDLEDSLMQSMDTAVRYRIGDDFHYTWTGANRMYVSAIFLKLGVAMNNGEYLHRVRYAVAEENASKDKQSKEDASINDGYFWDGSYMFHSGIMYNATYGRDQLSNTLNIVNYLYETPWQISQGMMDDMAKRVEDVYEYVIYNGQSVDAAGGRGVGSGISYGKTMTQSIEDLTKYLSDPYKTKLLSIAKQFKIDQGISDSLTKNESIPARGKITYLKRYPIGDKLILHTPDYGFTVSMFSDRTKTFEAPNGDAMQTWYASSGVTEIYNDDKEHYDRNYWISVDHYRLPGITVDKIGRTLTRFEGEMYNSHHWCGQIDCDNLYAVAGMQEDNYNSSMTAQKSWFVFDNEIVCLGSGISGGAEKIETIVDNRKLKDDNSNEVKINGDYYTQSGETIQKGIKTMYIEGNKDTCSYGYYFPEGSDLHVLRETRTEKEADMWLSDSTNTVTKNFFTMWYDHGKQPVDAQYKYVLLPNMTDDKVTSYANNPDTEILSQTDDVHAVREKTLNVTGYNFWNSKGGTVTGASSDGMLTLITKDKDNEFEASMTDPTFDCTRPVTVTFDISVSKVSECDSRITVLETDPLKIKVNLKDINGKKATIRASK